LQELAKAIASKECNTVAIRISWVGAVIDPYHSTDISTEFSPVMRELQRLFPSPPTLGMFTLPGQTSPEPLWGHISAFEWMPDREGLAGPPPRSQRLNKARDQWVDSFREDAKANDAIWKNRIGTVLNQISDGVNDWCARDRGQQWSPDQLKGRLDNSLEFLQRLDEALHHQDGPYTREHIFWHHRDIARLYQNTKTSQRENFVNQDEWSSLLTEYFYHPWLHRS
jgi:hypothetical protein